jgi:hypothetical protein
VGVGLVAVIGLGDLAQHAVIDAPAQQPEQFVPLGVERGQQCG